MSIIELVKDYITKAVTSVQGMKVLLLDKETVRFLCTLSFYLFFPPNFLFSPDGDCFHGVPSKFLFETRSVSLREPLQRVSRTAHAPQGDCHRPPDARKHHCAPKGTPNAKISRISHLYAISFSFLFFS